ncbi:hypothetical protein Goshw_012049 [Gossypium schwendimanii]|uniref:Uncharacterized protein n=1 Tax=Gossypium schwendimanii TaxID=34291 RepID=A0A7J9KRV1_GOSSC|nr:hypothetical protein [Gossypium schwendimanii]
MCNCMIVNLMPEASLEQQPQNQEVAEVLKSVRRYNLLFLGGARGFIQQKVRELPFFIKRIFQGLMDPDTNDTYISEIRLFAVKFSASICCEYIYIYIYIYAYIQQWHLDTDMRLCDLHMCRLACTSILCLVAMLLSIIYRATPLDFIPTANALWYVYASQLYKLMFFFSRFAGGIGIGRVFDCSAIILILILRLVGIYRRRRLMQRVRRLAAMELLQE